VSKSKKSEGAPSRGRGRLRTRKPVWVEIVRPLTREDIWFLKATENKGGRPQHPLNWELVADAAARPAGQTQRAFVRQWFERHYGRTPTPEEIISTEKRIRRRRI
jgi:hypothetical protein